MTTQVNRGFRRARATLVPLQLFYHRNKLRHAGDIPFESHGWLGSGAGEIAPPPEDEFPRRPRQKTPIEGT